MPVLHHFPLCPHSRFIRLVMGELQMEADLVETSPFSRERDFLAINPAGLLPVLVEHDGQVVAGADILSEYLDETRGLVLGDRRLLPENPGERVEVRRLLHWFNAKFFHEVSELVLIEKAYKRYFPEAFPGDAPNTNAIRASLANIRYHLQYVAHLVARRNWLAGDRLTYADLAAAAHFSVVDYFGDVPWETSEAAKSWYARVKSRPAFRVLLADRMKGILPAPHYTNLDF
ncbi:MAG: glutathione S-transferase [Methylobacterium sp.]|nr:MAG: glutathione S-transferase [Methylobacterium sp.]